MKHYLFILSTVCLLCNTSCQKSIDAPLSPEEQFISDSKDFLQSRLKQDEYSSLAWNRIAFYRQGGVVKAVSVPTIDNRNHIYVDFSKESVKGNWYSISKAQSSEAIVEVISKSLDHKYTGKSTLGETGKLEKVELFVNGILTQSVNLDRPSLYMSLPASVSGPNMTTLLLAQLLGIGQPDFNIGILLDENELAYIEPDSGGNGGGYNFYIDIIYDYSFPGSVDIQKMMNCFNNISDNGATYSISIHADLPVDNDPDQVMNGLTPGHAYISMTKTNGSQSVTQVFGFYPVSGFLSAFGTAVNSRMVNDGGHEYEAKMTLDNISQSEFNTVKNQAINHASLLYDLTDFNCTDYALELFNSIRSTGNELAPADTQFWVNSYQCTSPNGLYKLLKEMKDTNHPEASKISIGTANSPSSYGECN